MEPGDVVLDFGLNIFSNSKTYLKTHPEKRAALERAAMLYYSQAKFHVNQTLFRLPYQAMMIDIKHGTKLYRPTVQAIDSFHHAVNAAKQGVNAAKPAVNFAKQGVNIVKKGVNAAKEGVKPTIKALNLTKPVGTAMKGLKKVGPLSILCLGWDLWSVSQSEGEKDYVKPLVTNGVSILTGLAIDAAITGGCCIPVLGVLIVGAVVIDVFVSNLYDSAKDSLSGAKQSSNLGPETPGSAGMYRPGGVEFRDVLLFTSQADLFPAIVVSRQNNVYFQTDLEVEVLTTFHSLCAPRFRNSSLHTFFQTIVSEVQEGLQHTRQLPFVSLHFNKDALLYSVMHPFYRHTLLGSVLTYLDYFLKGFVNGGFFPVSFVREWEHTRTTDLNILNKHLHIIKKVLPASAKSYYSSLPQLLPQEQSDPNVYSSAFRIIGRMKTEMVEEDATFIPEPFFTVETDINFTPSYQAQIDGHANDALSYARQVHAAHDLMTQIIQYYMPKVPDFAPFFLILNMITFALHYVSGMKSLGLNVLTPDALTHTSSSSASHYIQPIPLVFPPLPVRTVRTIELEFTDIELIDLTKDTAIDNEFRKFFISNAPSFSKDFLNRISPIFSSHYWHKLSEKLTPQEIVSYEDQLEVENYTNQLIEKITDQKLVFIQQFDSLLESAKKCIKKITSTVLHKQSTTTKTSSSSFHSPVPSSNYPLQTDDLHALPDVFAAYKTFTTSIPQLAPVAILDNNELQMLLSTPRNLSSTPLPPLLTDYSSSSTSSPSPFENDVSEINKRFSEWMDAVQHFSTAGLKYLSQANKLYKYIFRLHLTNYSIQKGKNYIIHGGCSVAYNNKLTISHDAAQYKKLHSAKGVTFSLPLAPLGIEFKSVSPSDQSSSSSSSNSSSSSSSSSPTVPLLFSSSFQSSSASSHVPFAFFVNKPSSNSSSRPTPPSSSRTSVLKQFFLGSSPPPPPPTPSTIFTAACSPSLFPVLSNLLSSNTNCNITTANGSTPFLSAAATGNYAALKLFLSNEGSVTDINAHTETGMTPLHWAVYFNYPDVVQQLLQRGADLTITMKSTGMTPIHLACFHDRLACLDILVRNCSEPDKQKLFQKTSHKENGLHIAAQYAPDCASYILGNKLVADTNEVDYQNYTARDITLLSGQYHLARALPATTSCKVTLTPSFSRSSSSSSSIDKLCMAFRTGNVKLVEQTLQGVSNLSFDYSNRQRLIHSALADGNTQFVRILSELFPLKGTRLPPLAAKYSLPDWVEELKRYGADLTEELDHKTMFEYAALNADITFLNKSFAALQHIGSNILKHTILCCIRCSDPELLDFVSEKMKTDLFKDISLSLSDIITENCSFGTYNLFRTFVSPGSAQLCHCVLVCPLSILVHVLSDFTFSEDDLKNSIAIALRNERMDSAYVITTHISSRPCFASIMDSLKSDSSLPLVRHLTETYYTIAKAQLNKILSASSTSTKKEQDTLSLFRNTFNIGLLNIRETETLLDLPMEQQLWLLRVVPLHVARAFKFNTVSLCIVPSDFTKVAQIFKTRFQTSAGSVLLNALSDLDAKQIDASNKSDELISCLLSFFDSEFLFSTDYRGRTILPILSSFKAISPDTNSRLLRLIQSHFASPNKFEESRDEQGRTLLMRFVISNNTAAVDELLRRGVDVTTKDKDRNNILHLLLQHSTLSYLELTQLVFRIIQYSPELILHRNKQGMTPFHVAAQKGVNGVLSLFSLIYPVSVLDNLSDSSPLSALHYAASADQWQTIRFLVQNLHIDIHITTQDDLRSTPLHLAALGSATRAFRTLIELSANPLLNNAVSYNALNYGMCYGDDLMITECIRTQSYNFTKYTSANIVSIVQNPSALSEFKSILYADKDSVFRSVDSSGENVMELACKAGNHEAVQSLLFNGFSPLFINNNHNTIFHVCAKANIISCSSIIIKFIIQIFGYQTLQNVLSHPNSTGDLPVHVACSNGHIGFLSHLLTVWHEMPLNVLNSSGYSPLTVALLHKHFDCAALLAKYQGLLSFPSTSSKVLDSKLGPLWGHITHSEYFTSDAVVKKIRNANWGVEDLSDSFDKDIESYSKKIIENSKTLEQSELFQAGNCEDITLFMLQKANVIIPPSLYVKYSHCFSDPNFCQIICLRAQNDAASVTNLLKAVSTANDTASLRILSLLLVLIFPLIPESNSLDSFLNCVNCITGLQVPASHNLYLWLENGIVSAAEQNKHGNPMHDTETLISLILNISNSQRLMKILPIPRTPVPIHVFAQYALRNINSGYEDFLYLLLKYVHLLPYSCFLGTRNDSSSSLLSRFSVEFSPRINDEQLKLVNYALKTGRVEFIEVAVDATESLYTTDLLLPSQRERILSCTLQYIQKKKVPDASDYRSLPSWIHSVLVLVKNQGMDYLERVLRNLPSAGLSQVNTILLSLNALNSVSLFSPEIIDVGPDGLNQLVQEAELSRFTEPNTLEQAIAKFNPSNHTENKTEPHSFTFDGTPVFALSSDELKQLSIIGSAIQRNIASHTNYEEVGRRLGREFRTHRTLETAAQLVGLAREAIQSQFRIRPYLVQCLTVAAHLLHRVNKDNRNTLKGRISQVATGEGKSVIVAMLTVCLALTGTFVDVISSSVYLAHRDSDTFRPYYALFGLTCDYLSEDAQRFDYNSHIIYSTNVGFEFAFLRRSIAGDEPPLVASYLEDGLIERKPVAAVVDEADNLFIDTALNSARIAQTASTSIAWIFEPILNLVKENREVSTDALQEILKQYRSGAYSDQVDQLSDTRLRELFTSAHIALHVKQKGTHYMVVLNPKTQKEEVQIVDVNNTGRRSVGSRWSGGLHEFVELKEGLEIGTQNYTVASISHPLYFSQYDEIYGLTGTLGEETERKEITSMYHVDNFDVPPNKPCLRRRLPTLLSHSVDDKHKLIIAEVEKMRQLNRPVLVIVETISESDVLSELFHTYQIPHALLNDMQTEDEDFIVAKGSRAGAVTIATNTAGRGTDFKLSKECVLNGGLHVILGFLPPNLRVECQALGRAGRQGQPGSCRIILFDPSFLPSASSSFYLPPPPPPPSSVSANLPSNTRGPPQVPLFQKLQNNQHISHSSSSSELSPHPAEASTEQLKQIYSRRTSKVDYSSTLRKERFTEEQKYFAVLTQYFDYIRSFKQLLQLPEVRHHINNNTEHAFVPHMLISELQECWASFFTGLTSGDIEFIEDINMFNYFIGIHLDNTQVREFLDMETQKLIEKSVNENMSSLLNTLLARLAPTQSSPLKSSLYLSQSQARHTDRY